MIVALVVTAVYVYPINDLLFAKACGSETPERIRALVHQWILVDGARFVVGLVAFVALLQAFRIPAKS